MNTIVKKYFYFISFIVVANDEWFISNGNLSKNKNRTVDVDILRHNNMIFFCLTKT